jgi:transcriptional regulator with XRE-family HTH domain
VGGPGSGYRRNAEHGRLMTELRRQGLTMPEIARRLGITKQAVHDMLRRLGEPPPPRSVPCAACGRPILSAVARPTDRGKALCRGCLRERPAAPFGQRLLALRLAAGLSQVELARRAGLSRMAVAHHERAERTPRPATRARLARVLGPELLGGVRGGGED